MDLKDFQDRLTEMSDDIAEGIENDIPRIVGVEAVNHYQEGFQNEGFTDTSLIMWQEVKRRMEGSKARGADQSRKILTGRTGLLHDSIEYTVETHNDASKTIVYANPMNKGAGHNYAEAHQFGTATAGRNRNVTIPPRPFIGKSEALMKNINDRITRYFENIIKRIM